MQSSKEIENQIVGKAMKKIRHRTSLTTPEATARTIACYLYRAVSLSLKDNSVSEIADRIREYGERVRNEAASDAKEN